LEQLVNQDTNAAVFDWYAATIPDIPDRAHAVLAARLGAELRPAKGLHGYSMGTDFTRDGDVIAKMIWGGEQSPHAWASGSDAREFAQVVREEWPDHYVTRVDVAYDFLEGEPWAALYESCITTADYLDTGEPRERPLRVATLGDWVRADEGYPGGRTLYVGSMKSPVLARLYEKGKQMRALFPDQVDKYPEGWVRLELQVRPSGDARKELAKKSPAEFWGTARWARSLHGRVFSSQLEAVLLAEHRAPDDERAWQFMLRQYGPMLKRRVQELARDGSQAELRAAWLAIGVELGQRLGSIN
jgi:hypothetical protein